MNNCFVFQPFSLSFDLLTASSLSTNSTLSSIESSMNVFGTTHFYSVNIDKLYSCTTFSMVCFYLALGVLAGCTFPPERNRYQQRYRTSLFTTSTLLAFIFLMDSICLVMQQFPRSTIFILAVISVKSFLTGLGLVYMLYCYFDSTMTPVTKKVAQNYFQNFATLVCFGLHSSLIFYCLLFVKEPCLKLSFLIYSIRLCFLLMPLSLSMLLVLVWYGLAHVHKHTIINASNRKDFNFYFLIQNAFCHWLTMDCVCLTAQIEEDEDSDHKTEHLNEDNISTRTLNPWRKITFSILSSILFASFLSGVFTYKYASVIWWDKYYSTRSNGKLYLFVIFYVFILFC